MSYILQASPNAFIIAKDETVITSDYKRATQYPTIGAAMKAAAEVNKALGTHIIKAVYYAEQYCKCLFMCSNCRFGIACPSVCY